MGNHEYCINCGESDFHYHRPCDPAKVEARLKAKEQSERESKKETARLEAALKDLGVEYEIDQYGNATIRHSEYSDRLIAWRKERATVTEKCHKEWWAEVGWDDIIVEKCVRQKGHKGACPKKELI